MQWCDRGREKWNSNEVRRCEERREMKKEYD